MPSGSAGAFVGKQVGVPLQKQLLFAARSSAERSVRCPDLLRKTTASGIRACHGRFLPDQPYGAQVQVRAAEDHTSHVEPAQPGVRCSSSPCVCCQPTRAVSSRDVFSAREASASLSRSRLRVQRSIACDPAPAWSSREAPAMFRCDPSADGLRSGTRYWLSLTRRNSQAKTRR